MRWRVRKTHYYFPRDGEERTVVRFLFLPRSIRGETRWLCWAKIKQRYRHQGGKRTGDCDLFGPIYTNTISEWQDVSFVDKGKL